MASPTKFQNWLRILAACFALACSNARADNDEDVIELFVSAEMIRAEWQSTYTGMLAEDFLKAMDLRGPGGTAKPGTYSERDLKLLIGELDRIATPVRLEITAVMKGKNEEVRKVFLQEESPEAFARHWGHIVAKPGVRAWMKRNRDLMARSLPLWNYWHVITRLAPGKMTPPTVVAGEYETVSGALGGFRALLRELVNSTFSAPLLPDKYDIARVREEELQTRTQGISLLGSTPRFGVLSRQVDLTGQHFSQLITEKVGPRYQQAQQEIRVLTERARIAADPRVTGRCELEKRAFDIETLGLSDGDWRKVKDVAGKPLDPASREAWLLPYVWTTGCFVPKDPAAARRAMELFADSHHDKGRLAEFTHCTLAHWYRNGIGGSKDAEVAAKWEKRFKVETGSDTGCSPRLPVDPSDPWRIL